MIEVIGNLRGCEGVVCIIRQAIVAGGVASLARCDRLSSCRRFRRHQLSNMCKLFGGNKLRVICLPANGGEGRIVRVLAHAVTKQTRGRL